MHVTVPLAHGSATYDETKAFTRALAAELAAAEPERVTDRMGPAHRAGKVFVDWFANDSSRSLVAPYSLRASAAVPVVAAPFGWDEVQAAVAADQPRRLVVTHLELLDRLGDLTAVMRTAPQRLR
jgi:bifunctional non-homologous end joining protein LigD